MMEYYNHEVFDYSEKDLSIMRQTISSFLSIDDIMNFLKNQSWDLWGASTEIIKLIYKDFELKEVPKSKGYGPEGNVQVQSENFLTGLECAILSDNNIIQNFYSFAEFDT